jgi:hypothetical protein
MRKYNSVSEILTDESRWCQNVVARTDTGRAVSAEHHLAARFSLTGALDRVYMDDPADSPAYRRDLCALVKVINPTFYQHMIGVFARNKYVTRNFSLRMEIIYFNDVDARSFDDIARVIKQAGV